jgi:hypothetical protein
MSAATAAEDRRRTSIGLPAGCEEGLKVPGLMALEDGTVVDLASGEILKAETEALMLARRKGLASNYFASALVEGLAGEALKLGQDDAGEVVLLGADGRELVAGPGEGLELRAAALLLLEASTPWAAVGKADDGRVYGVGGAGYTPGLRFSPAYQRKQAARSRKVARQALRLIRQRLFSVAYSTKWAAGGKVLPVAWTLTTPTLDPSVVSGITEAREEERIFLAWSLFRKLEIFKSRVFACFRGYEVTRKVFWDEVLTFHPHFHLLNWSKFIEQAEGARAWWACLRTATLKVYGFDIDHLYDHQGKDKDGRTALDKAISASFYVQKVKRKPGKGDGAISLEQAIQETLKYATKADEIACYAPDPDRPGKTMVVGIPGTHLRAEIFRRSARVFERVGAARARWKAPEWCEAAEGVSAELWNELTGEAAKRAAALAAEAARSLDTPPISDGEGEKKKRETLRSLMLILDLHRWLQIASRRAFSSLEHLEKGLQAKGFWVPALAGGPPG